MLHFLSTVFSFAVCILCGDNDRRPNENNIRSISRKARLSASCLLLRSGQKLNLPSIIFPSLSFFRAVGSFPYMTAPVEKSILTISYVRRRSSSSVVGRKKYRAGGKA